MQRAMYTWSQPDDWTHLRPTVRPRGRRELAEKWEGPSTSSITYTSMCQYVLHCMNGISAKLNLSAKFEISAKINISAKQQPSGQWRQLPSQLVTSWSEHLCKRLWPQLQKAAWTYDTLEAEVSESLHSIVSQAGAAHLAALQCNVYAEEGIRGDVLIGMGDG